MKVVNFAIVILFLAVIAVNADLKDPALSAYYSFDDVKGTTIVDGSIHGNDAEAIGNPKFVDGKIGKAIELKPQVWIDLNGPEFKNLPLDGFSIAVWVNHNESPDPQSILDAIGNKHGDGLFHVEIRPAGFRFFHRNDAKAEVFNINPGPILKGKKWVHFAGTYNAKTKHTAIYVDGEMTHEAKGAGGDLATNWNVSAGIGHHKNGRWFDGLMDEFFLFAREITEDEIKQIISGEILAVDPNDKISTTWANIKN